MSEAKNNPKGGEKNLNQFNKYLDNNTDVLHEKFTQYYGDPFPFIELTSPDDLQYTLKYIYDVFNFGKYQANPTLNKTLKTSLVTNIKAFVQVSATIYSMFTAQAAVKLLKYCIQNNEMFAVHYDKKKEQKQVEEAKMEINEAEPIKNEQIQILQKKVVNQPAKQEKIQQMAKKTPAIATKVEATGERREQPIEKSELSEGNVKNEFLTHTQVAKSQSAQLISKKLKAMFQFYCKQQQSIAPHSTFDNINHKCQTMNLGKFMTFAIASNLLQPKEKSNSGGTLDKRAIVAAYKKIAGGERQIGFSLFLNLMEELKRVDHDLYNKMGVGVQEPKGKSKVLEKFKYINLPFSTRDPQGRQTTPFNNKAFISKLTTHSGKNEADLRDQLISRKQRAKCEPLELSRVSGATKMPQDQNNFSLKLGSSNQNIEARDLNFLSRLIKQEENDGLYLKDYQLPANKVVSLDTSLSKQHRYNQGKSAVPFISKSGALTSRRSKQRDFVLPSITKRGSQTENPRHSIGITKRFGDRSLLS